MDAAELKRWLASVARLTPAQEAELLNALGARDDEAVVGQPVESRLAQLPACPHCAGTRMFATAMPAACNADNPLTRRHLQVRQVPARHELGSTQPASRADWERRRAGRGPERPSGRSVRCAP